MLARGAGFSLQEAHYKRGMFVVQALACKEVHDEGVMLSVSEASLAVAVMLNEVKHLWEILRSAQNGRRRSE
ncbi:MAG: hypothetical protein NZ749_09700 [bacterium]|nr:hypothetical protein [bacterium]